MATEHSSTEVPLLRMRGITKSFGGAQALRGVDFIIRREGEIHTLVGENGSGKSTLLNVLSGQILPDEGSIEILGQPVQLRSARAAITHGIVMVSQETSIAPELSVAENILMGRQGNAYSWVRPSRMHEKAAAVLRRLGLTYDTSSLVRDLRADERQMVEVARAISMEARIIILDEPTSSLTEDEVARLYGAIERLKNEGVAVVFVSHRLPEVFHVSDEITVLRDGKSIDTGAASSFTVERLVEAMVGHKVAPTSPGQAKSESSQPDLLTVTEASVDGILHEISFDLKAGEIVGVAGLVGSGRTELLQALFGVLKLTRGAFSLKSAPYSPSAPREAITRRVAYLPPDRKTDGLVLSMPVEQNLSMVETAINSRWWVRSAREDQSRFEEAQRMMRLRAHSRHAITGTLSGGNQQKVALGKWFAVNPDLLLLDEPTRGVDIAAKAEIYEAVRELARAGSGVLVSSSDNAELLEICDRIVVLLGGRVVGLLTREEATQNALTTMAGGHL